MKKNKNCCCDCCNEPSWPETVELIKRHKINSTLKTAIIVPNDVFCRYREGVINEAMYHMTELDDAGIPNVLFEGTPVVPYSAVRVWKESWGFR